MSEFFLKDRATKDAFGTWLRNALADYGRCAQWAWNDEDSLCELFLGALRKTSVAVAGSTFRLNGYKVRGRGAGAGEKKLGADGLGVVRVRTATTTLNGFFLFQAKKCEKTSTRMPGVQGQSRTMLTHSAASVLMALLPNTVSIVSAMAAASHGRTDPCLDELPYENFANFAVHQLLHGFVLAPLDGSPFLKDRELLSQVKYVMTIIGAEVAVAAHVEAEVEQYLMEAGLGALDPLDVDANVPTVSPLEVHSISPIKGFQVGRLEEDGEEVVVVTLE